MEEPDAEEFDRVKTEKLAGKAYSRKDYETAAGYFTALITKAEQLDVEWYIKRCDCFQHLNMDAEAMNDATTIVKLHPESYKGYSLLGMLHQIQGHYDEALFCHFDCLEILWLSGGHTEHPQVAEKCLRDIVRSAKPVTELPENIEQQSVLTQLYILGNSLRREVQYTMAIRSAEVALTVYERSKMSLPDVENPETDDSEALKMKIYFVLAQCHQGIGKFDESIENYKLSLGAALRTGDVSYETKAYLNLSAICLDQDRFSEAASFYIRLLAVGEDVLSAVGGDMDKFREHWSAEMEASILLNLCIAFKSMRLYDEALKYALRYDTLVAQINFTPSPSPDPIRPITGEFRPTSVPTLGFAGTIFSQKSVDLSGVLQSKFILGDLHELRGDLDDAMTYYQEWMMLSQTMSKDVPGGIQNPYLLDTASSLSCQGSVYMKKGEYKNALECFKQQNQIAKLTKIPQLLMESALSRGDALIALKRIGEARNAYNYAQKLSRQSMDDLEPECWCMWKGSALLFDAFLHAFSLNHRIENGIFMFLQIASVFAAEYRFTHAAYYCEQAVALANKCGKRSVQMKLKFELALYYQHSNSSNELQKAASILIEMIKFQEENIHIHRTNGGKYFHEEENMLEKCYNAMQVIFHKLGEQEYSAAFAEAWRRRKYVQLNKKAPQIPEIPMSAISDIYPKQEVQQQKSPGRKDLELNMLDYQEFLPRSLPNKSIVLTFNLCDGGFLAQLIQPGVGIIKSYLSSDNDAKPFLTRGRIEGLVEKLGKISSGSSGVSQHLCNIYNTESRCLQHKAGKSLVPLPQIGKVAQKPKQDKISKASGDHAESNQKPAQPISRDEGQGDAPLLGEAITKKPRTTLEELYEILIMPLEETFAKQPTDQHMIVVPDKDLWKIPFDALKNPDTGLQLCNSFNITLLPSFYFLPVDTTSSKTSSPQPMTKKSPAKASAQTPQSKVRSPRPTSSPRKSTKLKQSALSPRKANGRANEEKGIKEFRHNELMKSFDNEKSLLSLELAGLTSSIGKLVTETATGTNVLTSPRYVPKFRQASKLQKCSVIGCPALPRSLLYQGQIWNPRSNLPVALKECKKVSEYLDVDPKLGAEATKSVFLQEMKSSSVLHVATYADASEGCIAFKPDSFPAVGDPPGEGSYLVSADDLVSCHHDNIQLLILSCGHGWPHSSAGGGAVVKTSPLKSLYLPSLLLSSGVQCVLYRLWNVPDAVNELLYFHFYDSLQNGNFASKALKHAKDVIREKHSDPAYWAGFILLGRDVYVDLSEIRKSQLHASLDLAEAEQLDVKSTIPDVVKPETAMHRLQEHFSRLAGHLCLNPLGHNIVGALIELLEEAMDRLTADSNTNRPLIVVPDIVSQAEGAIGFLNELGFDFQPADVPVPPPTTSHPTLPTGEREVAAVVFPHWNKDGLLLPAHQALTGLQDICSSDDSLQHLAKILPMSQALLCSVIDLFSVTRHTPEVQLRIHDAGVAPVWKDRHIRQYLLQVGFTAVHGLLIFYKTSKHRTLLIASLQVFASLCLHRDQGVLERLNITTLGQSPADNLSTSDPSTAKKMTSLNPVVLPRKEIILTSSWVGGNPERGETKEFKSMADKLSQAKEDYGRALSHAKWWHKNLLTPQAQIKLSTFGAEKAPKPLKRKVKAGATPSCQRESIDGTPVPRSREPFYIAFAEAMRKRDYANYLARKRCDELESRLKASVHEIYKKYAVNA